MFPRIPFLRVTGRFRCVVAGVVFALSGLFVLPAFSQSEPEVVAVVRAEAPKALIERVMGVARKIMPGPQTEALPFFLGGMLGDPMFESVSQSENFGLVILAHEEELAPVLVLKLTDESVLRQTLPNFDLRLHDAEGWTFGMQEGSPSELILGREAALIAAVRAKRQHDIELAAHGRSLVELIDEFSEVPAEFFGESVNRELAEVFFKALRAEIGSAEDFLAGLDLSPETIRQTVSLKGVAGSPLAAFLTQKRPDDFGFARFVPGSDEVLYLGGYDVGATRRYFDHLFASFSGAIPGDYQEVFEKTQKLLHDYFDRTDGRVAGTMGGGEPGEMLMTKVDPSKMTDAELVSVLEQGSSLLENALKLFGEGMDSESVERGSGKSELVKNSFEINGVPVHTLKIDLQVSVEGDDGFHAGFGKNAEDEVHYAVVDGYVINASTLSRMTELVDAIQSGKAVENNLGEKLRLSEDQLFVWSADISNAFSFSLMPAEEDEPKMRLENLQPVRGTVSAKGGVGKSEISIPVDTIAALVQAAMAEMSEMFQPGVE